MKSVDEMIEEEDSEGVCIFKKSHSYCYIECKQCDGFNYNCASYEVQRKVKYISENDSD